ncbi:ABC transporter permease [Acidianus sp. HS-5]|uniref:ABC transporter permease n=1 Tax=Acidianus sp. HS-5 TaxID=2886040 RepID=UPI001F41FCE4|nr:ABC transporter permease [Acidianus sp. HS-5]BDC18402.1 ABC transporter [Acidianus sp. HS-5]
MKNMLSTAKAIIKDNLSNKATIFFILVFPLFLTLIFAFGFAGINHVTQVVATNNQDLAKYLNSTQLFVGITCNNEREAILHNYIYIYTQNESYNISYPEDAKYLIPSLEAVLNEYSTHSSIVVSATQLKGFTYVDYILSGMIGVIALSNGVFGVTGVGAGYYRDKLVERLAASPLKSYEWVISLMLYEIVITFISIVPILLLGLALGFIPIIGVLFVVFLIVGTLMFSGLGAIIFGLTPKDKLFIANVAANIVTLPLIFLSNAFFYINSFPGIIQLLINYQPVSVLNDIIRQVTVYQQLPQAWEIAYIIIFTITSVFLGEKLLKLREID